jgi:hypothetical protein
LLNPHFAAMPYLIARFDAVAVVPQMLVNRADGFRRASRAYSRGSSPATRASPVVKQMSALEPRSGSIHLWLRLL